MLPPPLSIALVNYLNAKPFLYGIENGSKNENNFHVHLLNPAECARSFMARESEVALVPVGSLHYIQDYKIITRFGIAADKEVKTVCLLSNTPIEECHHLILDNHSMTSVLLTKLLIKNVFLTSPTYSTASVGNLEVNNGEAVLMIGDKVFEHENLYSYKYDLASVWNQWTGLPFVFAVWIAQNNLSESKENQLEELFAFGINHLDQVIQENQASSDILKEYYSKYIRYQLDENYFKALHQFLDLTKEFV